jgi:hypothetical protein
VEHIQGFQKTLCGGKACVKGNWPNYCIQVLQAFLKHFEKNVTNEDKLLEINSAIQMCLLLCLEVLFFYFRDLKKNVWIDFLFLKILNQ